MRNIRYGEKEERYKKIQEGKFQNIYLLKMSHQVILSGVELVDNTNISYGIIQ